MNALDIVLVAVAILAFGLVSRRLATTVLTAPIFFVALGMLVSPASLGWLHVEAGEGVIHLLAEVTLVFVLFGDAARIDLRVLWREIGLPVRLLGIGLPLTIGLGTLAAKLFFPSLSWFEAGVLGALLAPTDAALGQAVVSSPAVPLRIRQALNVESGLNDGIALPAVMMLAALGSAGTEHARGAGDWVTFAVLQVTLGPLVGIASGWIGGALIASASKRGWIAESFARPLGAVMALLSFGLAEVVGGNGFIAAFVAGLTLGNTQRDHCGGLHEFLEAEGQLFVLVVFLFMGSSLAWPAIEHADGRVLLYALASLTLVRMIPVAISLIGSRLRAPSLLFLGWFGPRGLATVLFAILIVDEANLPHGRELFDIAILTALLSVLLHGVTAVPGAARYAATVVDQDACGAEHEVVAAHPLRVRA